MTEALLNQSDLKYATQFANKFFVPTPQDREDLNQAAMEGLLEAAAAFRPELSPPGGLASFAYPYIRNRVLREVHAKFFSHLTYRDFLRRRQVLALREKAWRGQRELTAEELSDELGIGYDKAVEMLRDSTAEEVIADEDIRQECLTEKVEDGLILDTIRDSAKRRLSAKDYFLLVRRYGLDGYEPFLLSDLAELLGISRQAVAKRLAGALSTLKIDEVQQ